MNYWLFTVMYDFTKLWKIMVERGLAAQHYPVEWTETNYTRNVQALQKLKRGDWLVAAFMRHRFAGYARLTSDFYRGGKSLGIRREGELYDFYERVDVDWTVIPPNKEPPYITCSHLKAQGYDIDLKYGFCLKRTDKKTFVKLKTLLDRAGAQQVRKQVERASIGEMHAPLLLTEGQRARVQIERAERNPAARRDCVRAHGVRCSVCKMSFEQVYGAIGSGYIEVHHLSPLSGAAGERSLDPVADLRPVCPNCHAMLHRRAPPLTIEELSTYYRAQKASNRACPTSPRRGG